MKKKRKKSKWLETFTRGANRMTRLEVFDYYNNPVVSEKITDEIKRNRAIVIQKFEDKYILRRHHNNKWIRIKKPSGDKPSSLDYWARRHLLEVHKVIGPKTDEVIIDIDPNNVKLQSVKGVIRLISDKLESIYNKKPEVIYSGGRGFYVRVKLDSPQHVNKIRKTLKEEVVKPLVKRKGFLVDRKPKKGEIRIDLSPMKSGGSYRVPYSINGKTGLTAVPVDPKDIRLFHPGNAIPQFVMIDLARRAR